ncbi:hypothetical protein [Flavobacterium sp.]|uniref:hypothetical protein n=1 Tax=Flavobacterium sp. TaxID=239 RepID=UPI004033F4EF
MKYVLVCFLLVIGCKPVKDTVNADVVGIALNEKYGAVLYGNGEIYTIAGLQKWDSIYLDKKVKVKGNFKLMIGKDKVEIKNFGTFHAQTYPRYYVVENATWELYTPD